MEAASSASKVTVALYWDPAALFPVISAELHARLPLRNLHWKSPNRPLRSINFLHVDLVPYNPPQKTASSSSPPTASSNTDLTRVRSAESTQSSGTLSSTTPRPRGATNKPRKERRHQIPGLRNTPYLKLYILRCDDNESYKSTQRKLVREWISTHATAEGVDNHDAFEWLILHVVLPGTQAASQPRTSSGSSPSGGPRWMKTGSATLLDKIKSDFNSSSSKVDRIIQMRISTTHTALGTLSPPVSTLNQPPIDALAETEISWVDLVNKFKTQILASFDARVGQYEEDIREKDSQRRLPGWNFCTFFVLKEGLARAFESVGLVEDALVLYDELGFGLEAMIQDQGQYGEITSGNFHAWTKECLWWVEDARKRLAEGNDPDMDNTQPIDAEKKPYRELILSNEISLLDFRCYLFSRQIALLVRLGRRGDATTNDPQVTSAAVDVPGPIEGENLYRLAEVCNRGIEFVTSVCKVLRADLWTGYTGRPEDQPAEKTEVISAIIDNLVSSWTFGVVYQLLAQTVSAPLSECPSSDPGQGLLPRRTSSLVTASHRPNLLQTTKPQSVGLEQLAAGRAELLIIARNVVEYLGKKRGWVGQRGLFETAMEDIKLTGGAKASQWIPAGIRNPFLKDAMSGEDKNIFFGLFGQLSERATKHYEMARWFKSARRVEADIAALTFRNKNYTKAAAHLERLTDFHNKQGWGVVETALLGMYAKCLKEMQRPEEYVRVLLKLLAKGADAEISNHVFDREDINGYMREALLLSETLSVEISIPMHHIWSDIVVHPYPQALRGRDGFQVDVTMRYLLDEEMVTDQIAVRLASAVPSGKHIWLESTPGPIMRKGTVKSFVQTHETIPGVYTVDCVMVYAKKLTFSATGGLLTKSRLVFRPSSRNLVAVLRTPKKIQLDQTRMLDLLLHAGDNHLLTGELRLRSATAGLRLMTGALEVVEGNSTIVEKNKSGHVIIAKMPSHSVGRFRIPYNSETELGELSVRIEVDYTTKLGEFRYIEILGVQVSLPLAVNVQDVFKANALFSKFQISTAAAEVPLRITKATLTPSKSFDARGGQEGLGDLVVFSKQPASFIYKIIRKSYQKEKDSLALAIHYTSLDEEVGYHVRSLFEAGLASANLQVYINLLLPVLLTKFRHLASAVLESAALLNEVELGEYVNDGWDEALEAISPANGERSRVRAWLKCFYRTHVAVPLTQGENLASIARVIIIPVEVPQLQVIHTVRLEFLNDTESRSIITNQTAPPMITVGQVLHVVLVITHSRRWDSVISGGFKPLEEAPLEFFLELHNHLDTWLISGRKRAHFTACDGSEHRFPLMLVPVKSGHLLLPNVEIKLVDGNASVETDYAGSAGTVLVLPDVRSTTIRIDSSYGAEQLAAKS